jgi:hypothetical protein
MVLIVNFRGAVTRVRSTDMAFAMRQPGYEVHYASGQSEYILYAAREVKNEIPAKERHS